MSKGLEALKELLKNHSYHEEDCDRVVIIEQELKALEIIKEKEVQVATLLLSNTCYGYNFARGLLGEYLTEEEYDLLKEVFEK